MTPDEAVADLSTVDVEFAGDIEAIHAEADAILLRVVPDAVRQAYNRLEDRIEGFRY